MTDYTDFCPYDSTVEWRKKMDVGNVFFNQVKCLECGYYIRSKNRHHMVSCKCGKTSVDGGSWYTKASGPHESHVLMFKNLEENV